MRLLTVPASRGVLWVRSGFRVFFGRPLAFAALFASFLFGAMLLLLVPVIGTLLLSLPAATATGSTNSPRAGSGRWPACSSSRCVGAVLRRSPC